MCSRDPSSDATEPVIASIRPVAPRLLVGNIDRGDEFWILEAELGGDADLERIAVFRRQDFIGETECHQSLRMEGSRHVDALVVAVGTFKADIARSGVGADPLQKGAQWRAAPPADHAPALDADVARDLADLR